jgi:hypothetical protein
VSSEVISTHTKAEIDADGGFTWRAGDQIAVYSTKDPGYVVATLLEGEEGKKKSGFVIDSDAEELRTDYSVYPAGIELDAYHDASDFRVLLPAVYDNVDKTNPFAVQLPMAGPNISDEDLSLYHLGGLLRLTLRNLPAGADRIEISTGKNLSGEFAVDTSNPVAMFVSTESGTGSNGTTLTFNLKQATTANETVVLNIPLPVGEHDYLSVQVKQGGTPLNSLTDPVPFEIRRAKGRTHTMDNAESFTLTPLTVTLRNYTDMSYSVVVNGNTPAVNSGLVLAAYVEDPSIASVTVLEYPDALPVLHVAGLKEGVTKVVASAYYNNRVLSSEATVTVSPDDYSSVTIHGPKKVLFNKEQRYSASFSTDLEPDSYEWELTSGTAASLIQDGTDVVIVKGGDSEGDVTLVCKMVVDGRQYASASKSIHIQTNPPGTVRGVFTKNTDGDVFFFSEGKLMRDRVNSRYIFETPQYQTYSGVEELYKAPDNSLHSFWDMFKPGTISTDFKRTPNTTKVYVGSGDYTQWYLLSSDILQFVFTDESRGELRFARGNIADINGMFLFPDDYKHPAGCAPVHDKNGGTFASNYFSLNEWALMEAAGVVFLPASGYYINGNNYTNTNAGAGGYYLVYPTGNSSTLQCLSFTDSALSYNSSANNNYYYSVRLVHD